MNESSVAFLADVSFYIDREMISGVGPEEFGLNIQIGDTKYPSIIIRRRSDIISGNREMIYISVVSFSGNLDIKEDMNFNLWSDPANLVASGNVMRIV